MPVSSPRFASGDYVGRFEILAPLGVGGMDSPYRALEAKLNRDVTLKVLPEAFVTDPERLARFEREAEVLAPLNHPNVGTCDRNDATTILEARSSERRPRAPHGQYYPSTSKSSPHSLQEKVVSARSGVDRRIGASQSGHRKRRGSKSLAFNLRQLSMAKRPENIAVAMTGIGLSPRKSSAAL